MLLDVPNWAGYLIVLGVIVIMCSRPWQLIGHYPLASFYWTTGVMELLVVLYVVGVVAKITLTGPEFFRFHLADVGFPVFVASVLFGFYKLIHRDTMSPLEDSRANLRRLIGLFRIWKFYIGLALVLSITYEILTGLMYANANPGTSRKFVGGFDFVDVGMYVAGSLAGYLIVHFSQSLHVTALNELNAKAEAVSRARVATRRPRGQRRRSKKR